MNKFAFNRKYVLKELQELGLVKLGRGNVISKNDIRDQKGNYPIYSSSALNNGMMGEYGKYMFEDERITWSIDGGGMFFYRHPHKYSVTNVSGWARILNETIINTKFLYYSLLEQWKFKKYDYTKKAHPSVIREEYEIFLPPLEVQKEIVEILDKFTTLEAELEAELEARRKQYDFYLKKLVNNINESKLIKVSEFADVKIGATPKTSNKDYWDSGTIPWMSSGEIHYKTITKTEKLITQLGFKNSSTFMLPKGTVLIALAGQGITRGNVAITGIELCTNQSIAGLINIKPNLINSKFIYYYLKTQYDYLRMISSGDGTRGGLNSIMIKNLEIPVPPIKEQNRIVEILDKFSELVEDIEKGLPKEIELRRKQYEYYRNKLLTFEEQ